MAECITKRFNILAYLWLLLLVTTSCRSQNDIEKTCYTTLYSLSGISIRGTSIYPDCTYNNDSDLSSKSFYQLLDTSLCFQRIKPHHVEHQDICAIDWRVTDINILALEDYDLEHKAGSSLNDLFLLEYWYKTKRISIPVTDVKYGTLMLADYYPFDPLFYGPLYLRQANELSPSPHTSFKVIIKDAFGNTFEGTSKAEPLI